MSGSTATHDRGVYTCRYQAPGGRRRIVAVDSSGRVVAHADVGDASRDTIVAHRLRELLDAIDPAPSLKIVR